jgi:sugar lactone lactonase YvrE
MMTGPTGTVAAGQSQYAYVGNAGDSVTSYPVGASGNAAPSGFLSNGTTAHVGSLAFDSAADLWVGSGPGPGATSGVLYEYKPAQLGSSGVIAPAVQITSDSVGVNTGAAFDFSGELWVACQGCRSFSEFVASQLSSSGTKSPAVTISTGSASPNGIAIDTHGDVWVSSSASYTPGRYVYALSEYTPAELASSGSPSPAVVIANSGSLSLPARLAFDRSGDLWVANNLGNTVVEYTPAELASSGSPAPAVVLSSTASDSLDAPNGLAFDAAGDLWVADEGSNSAVEFSPSQLGSSGSPAPVDTIGGSATGISDPWVIAVGPGAPPSSPSSPPPPSGPAPAPPRVSITAPANGATYTAGEFVEAIYACQPGASGALRPGTAGCSGTVPNGEPIDTSTGTHTFSVTATDTDGQTASVTIAYTVVGLSMERMLRISLEGDGTGKVIGSGIACPHSCSRTYPVGSRVRLVARPTRSSVFAGWDGPCHGTGDCKLTMSSGRVLGAVFIPKRSRRLGALGTLIDQRIRDASRLVRSLRPDLLATQLRAALLPRLGEALRAVAATRLCAANSLIEAARSMAKGHLVSPASKAAVDAALLGAESSILSSASTSHCGGASSAADTREIPTVAITSEDNREVTFRVVFPIPSFTAQRAAGTDYEQISDGALGEDLQHIGSPEVPLYGTTIAVPEGATASVHVSATAGYHVSLDEPLFPVQAPGADGVSPSVSTQRSSPAERSLLPYRTPPFSIDHEVYASRLPVPRKVIVLGPVTTMRTLPLSTVTISTGRYLPRSKQLFLYTSLVISVTFKGHNSGVFGGSTLVAPWNRFFESLYAATVLNWPSVPHYLSAPVRTHARLGARTTQDQYGNACSEMLVITSPALVGVADRFAGAKEAVGISTGVFTTGAVNVGTTAISIRNFISVAYQLCSSGLLAPPVVVPSFVTIIGDTSQVPTFEISLGYRSDANWQKDCDFGTNTQRTNYCPNFFEDPVASDQPYGFVHQAAQVDSQLTCQTTQSSCTALTDLRPDVMVGRIPAGNANQADAEVTAIDSYGFDTNHSWATTVTGAEFFQPCADPGCPAEEPLCVDGTHAGKCARYHGGNEANWPFMSGSELTGALAEAIGASFCRVASDEQAADNGFGFTITPTEMDNGVDVPPGVSWTGGPNDIDNCINSGSFFVWHSDHGYTDGSGWYEPAFRVADVGALTEPSGNPAGGWELPVVWSSDCDQLKFDDPTATSYGDVYPGVSPSFGEAWLEDTKAVAFIGASRESAIKIDATMLTSVGALMLDSTLLDKLPGMDFGHVGQYLATAQATELAYWGTNAYAIGNDLEYNLAGDPSTYVQGLGRAVA